MRIIYTSGFLRSYKKLPEEIRALAESKVKVFRRDPFVSALKTHKLHGPFKGFWAFSLNLSYRIIFEFNPKNDEAYFHSIGDHGIYD